MTIFIEPFRKPNEHLMFLHTLLYAECKKEKKIIFISSREYFNSIQDNFKNQIEFIESNAKKNTTSLIFYICKLILLYYKKYRKFNLKIILLSSRSYSNLILKIFSFFYLKKAKIYIFLHGELQNTSLNMTMSHIVDGLIQRFTYKIDTLFNTKIKFVVISSYVFEKLKNKTKNNLNNFIHLDLPYYYTTIDEVVEDSNSNKISLALVGVCSRNKNSESLNILSDFFIKEINLDLIEFMVIGRNEDITFRDYVRQVDFSGKYLLSDYEFSNLVKKCDFILFFNQNNNYDLISSGSYFDSIKYQKPILALSNSQWQYNFKNFGEIGILFNSIEEMADYIKLVITNQSLKHSFKKKLADARSKTDIKSNLEIYNKYLS